jgi:hypothetical protein
MQALFAAGGSRESLKNAPLTTVNFGGGTTPPPPQYAVIDTKSSLSASTNTQTSYGPYSTVGASAIKFVLSGGTGDADLYVKFGSAPTLQSYDCRPYLNGNAETCEFNPSQSGNYFVMVHAYTAYSGLTLTVSRAGGSTTSPEVCTDGTDNDGDGATDCNDSDCSSDAACQPDPEVCDDSIDNDGDGATDCDDDDCSSVPSCGSTGGSVTISSVNFTSGLSPYVDGGTDARYISSGASQCFSGGCAELRDDTTSSKITSPTFNLTGFTSAQIDFIFRTSSFENNELIIVEMSLNGGSTWTLLDSFAAGSNFNNGTFYGATVPVNANFTSNTRFRFRADASADDDKVYLDDIEIVAQ